MQTKKLFFSFVLIFSSLIVLGQDYFFKDKAPFNPDIPSPEAFLGYPIGEQHTRHDLIVAYLTKLAEISDRAEIETYGYTHEKRKLVMLRISTPEHLKNMESIKVEHLKFVDPNQTPTNYNDVPV